MDINQIKDSISNAEKKPTLMKVADSTVKIVDDYDLNELNDYELGYVYGQTAYNEGKPLEQALAEVDTDSLEFKKGFEVGYYNAVALPEEEDLNEDFGQLVDSYRKDRTKENFVRVLKGVRKLQDSDSDDQKDYGIVKNGEDYQVGVKYNKKDLDTVKELLDNDSNLEIKGEEDDYVIVGEKTADSNKFVWKSVKRLAKKNNMFVNLQGIFDSNGDMVAPVESVLQTFDMAVVPVGTPDAGNTQREYLEKELNSLLAEEYLAWYAYERIYQYVHSPEGKAMRELLGWTGSDELNDHARHILDRMADIDIHNLLITPTEWNKFAKHIPAAPDAFDYVDCLNSLLSDENSAIAHYKEVIDTINSWNEPDYTTVELLKHILADEEQHKADICDLLTDSSTK